MATVSCIVVGKMDDLHYDLCVIGGGINGAGIARDAAGRGLSVLLVEAQDLAGATSSASSKLIHGGIRYLENYEFSMVRKALKEREIIYKTAPHIVRPMECVVPQAETSRPQWMLRLGVWLYDHLGGRTTLPKSRMLDFVEDPTGKPLLSHYTDGIGYYDCWGDDTRLVISNVVDAAARNAEILTRTSCVSMEVEGAHWRIGLKREGADNVVYTNASMVVNATGPWVRQFLDSVGADGHDPDLPDVRLVKGSHLLFPKLYDGDHAYVLQQDDGRIVFVAPYEDEYTLVGTTEEDYEGDPRDARISDEEMNYLLSAYNNSFSKQVSEEDVVFALSGVRPLIDDGNESSSKVTRDYKIYHHKRFDPPFLSVYGGKLTTYRAVSEDVINVLMRLSGHVVSGWTSYETIAGGDFGGQGFDVYLSKQKQLYPWLPDDLLRRYLRTYGTRMDYFLHGKGSTDDLGEHLGEGVYQSEIKYLVTYEWAQSAEDIIWRRGKLGLHISEETIEAIEQSVHNLRTSGGNSTQQKATAE